MAGCAEELRFRTGEHLAVEIAGFENASLPSLAVRRIYPGHSDGPRGYLVRMKETVHWLLRYTRALRPFVDRSAVFRVLSLLTPIAKMLWSGTMSHQSRAVTISFILQTCAALGHFRAGRAERGEQQPQPDGKGALHAEHLLFRFVPRYLDHRTNPTRSIFVVLPVPSAGPESTQGISVWLPSRYSREDGRLAVASRDLLLDGDLRSVAESSVAFFGLHLRLPRLRRP